MNDADAIRLLWAHLRIGRPAEPADLIFVPGHADLRCAAHAAALWHAGLAPLLVFSGATGRSTAGVFHESEAVLFSREARRLGVPDAAMILEVGATNTGENVRHTRALLAARGVSVRRLLVVQKPYAERRIVATLRHHWPEAECLASSAPATFEEYATARFTAEDTVHMMVGEIHRLLEYPRRGWQRDEPVPAGVVAAFEHLVAAGYTRELIPGARP